MGNFDKKDLLKILCLICRKFVNTEIEIAMINDELGKALHDKASRGEQMSETEQQQLEEWYAYQDRLELEAIQLPTNDTPISDLQSQVEAAFEQLVKLSNRIQKVAAENEQLRNENAILLDQLSQQFGRQAV